MTNYGRDYIEERRSMVDQQVSSYRQLVAAAADCAGTDSAGPLDAAIRALEPVFFNNLVLALDNYFVHRSRTLEKKDGNALNEVRMLSTSLMSNGGRLAADKQIKLPPDKSLLGYDVGDEISLSEDDFVRLAKAYFEEIASKFT